MLEEPPENGLFLLDLQPARPAAADNPLALPPARSEAAPARVVAIARPLAEHEPACLGGRYRSCRGALGRQPSPGDPTLVGDETRDLSRLCPASPPACRRSTIAACTNLRTPSALAAQEDAFDGFIAAGRRLAVAAGPSASRNRRGPCRRRSRPLRLPVGRTYGRSSRDSASLQAETLNLDRKQVVLQVFMALADATRM